MALGNYNLLIMKKVLLSAFFLTFGIVAFGQLRKPNYELDPGQNLLFINFYDASTINQKDYVKKISISDINITIIANRDTIRLKSGNHNGIDYNKPLKAKEIELILAKDGYDTLRQVWKITSLSTVLEAYLTKKK